MHACQTWPHERWTIEVMRTPPAKIQLLKAGRTGRCVCGCLRGVGGGACGGRTAMAVSVPSCERTCWPLCATSVCSTCSAALATCRRAGRGRASCIGRGCKLACKVRARSGRVHRHEQAAKVQEASTLCTSLQAVWLAWTVAGALRTLASRSFATGLKRSSSVRKSAFST